MITIDIDGPSAVGKTTLIRSLNEKLPDSAPVSELLSQKPNPYIRWTTPEEFLKKQLWFFEHTVQRYLLPASPDQKIRINDIGITDVIIHTFIYPAANNLPWDVFTDFQQAVIHNYPDLALANHIFYLHASAGTIAERRKGDTQRIRNAFESNMKLYPYQKEFYFRLMERFPGQVRCMDGEKSTYALTAEIIQELDKRKNSPSIRLYDLLSTADFLKRH
ncbi:hypothetical protein AALB39_07610 [Lachnospiraceae bacterium 54-53]